jgi:hypothetical protein
MLSWFSSTIERAMYLKNRHVMQENRAGCKANVFVRASFVLEYQALKIVERSAVGGDGSLHKKGC